MTCPPDGRFDEYVAVANRISRPYLLLCDIEDVTGRHAIASLCDGRAHLGYAPKYLTGTARFFTNLPLSNNTRTAAPDMSV